MDSGTNRADVYKFHGELPRAKHAQRSTMGNKIW